MLLGAATDSTEDKGFSTFHEVARPLRKTFISTLKPWSGIDREAPFFMTILRAFTYFVVPSVFWVVASYGKFAVVLNIPLLTIFRDLHRSGSLSVQLHLSHQDRCSALQLEPNQLWTYCRWRGRWLLSRHSFHDNLGSTGSLPDQEERRHSRSGDAARRLTTSHGHCSSGLDRVRHDRTTQSALVRLLCRCCHVQLGSVFLLHVHPRLCCGLIQRQSV